MPQHSWTWVKVGLGDGGLPDAIVESISSHRPTDPVGEQKLARVVQLL